MCRRFVYFFVLIFLLPLLAFSQNESKSKAAILKEDLLTATSDTHIVSLLNNLSYELRRSDATSAVKYATDALELSMKESNFAGAANAYLNLGDIYRSNDNNKEALINYNLAIDLSTEKDLKAQLQRTFNKMGVLYMNISDYPKALHYLKLALPITQELDDKFWTSVINNNMGNIYYLTGDYKQALDKYLESLRIQKKSDDKTGVAASCNNIANIFLAQNNYTKALEYYQKGLEIKEELNDKKGIANTYCNMGSLYFLMKETKTSKSYYDRARKISEEIKDYKQLANVLVNIGRICSEENNYNEAISKYTVAGLIYQSIDDKRGFGITLLQSGTTLIKAKSYEKGIAKLNYCLSIFKKLGVKEEIKETFFALAAACEKMGDFKKANEYYKDFITIKDSLITETSAKNFSDLEAKYRSEAAQNEIDLLKKEKEIQSTKLKRDTLIIYSSVTVTILMLLIALVIYRNNRMKQNANALLLDQNIKISRQKDEKEVLLKEVHHRVKNNLQVVNSLLNIQSAYTEDARVSALFADCRNRIQTMALIHEKLYSSSELNKVELEDYLSSLTREIIRSYQLNRYVELDLQVSVKDFGITTLIPVGLLLNELFSNSLKHAFVGEDDKGKISISINKIKGHEYEMIIGDNGKGIDNKDLKNPESLGLELIHTFVKQLDGTIERLPEPGTVFRIVFNDIGAIKNDHLNLSLVD
jgi:two-component system, sensor histidine kinase PdtaS